MLVRQNLRVGNILVGICKWWDKRDVMYLSIEFKNKLIETETRRGQNKTKTEPIAIYNKYILGIDHQDQMYLLSLWLKNDFILRWCYWILSDFITSTKISKFLFKISGGCNRGTVTWKFIAGGNSTWSSCSRKSFH